MKQILFFIFALLAITASARTMFTSLGKVHNNLVNRDLEIKACVNSEKIVYVEVECPTSAYSTGFIRIMGDDLPRFNEALGKTRKAMDVYIKSVECDGYDGNTALTGFPTVTYKWDGITYEKDAEFMIIMRHENGRYLASIAHEAKSGNSTATFFMQFESLDEIDYLLTLLNNAPTQ